MLNNGGSNNGGLSGGGGSGGSSCGSNSGMGTPDMYGNGSGPGGAPSPPSSGDYPPNNFPHHHPHPQGGGGGGHYHPQQHHRPSHLPSHHPHHQGQGQGHGGHEGPGGMLGHHSGGICSQMGLNNQGACTPQDSKLRPCFGCGEGILDRVIFEVWDRYWHHSCLKCAMCGCNLADLGPTCFSRDGMMLCKSDYMKMFGMKGACRGCGQHIPSNEFVMRAGSSSPMGSPPMVFHVGCFNCSKCGKALSTGDRYSVLSGALFCESDALKVMKQNGIGSPGNASVAASNGPTTAPRKGKVGRPRRSRD